MYKVEIRRYFGDDCQQLGTLTLFNNELAPIFSCISLERGWLDNKPNESSIPKGKYSCVLEYSPRFNKNLWELKGVPNRTECKFHASNYWNQLNGCIALGKTAINIGRDFRLDITNSGATMDVFHDLLVNENEIIVDIK